MGPKGAIIGGIAGRIYNGLTHSSNFQLVFEDSEGELVIDDKNSSFVPHINNAVKIDAQKRLLTSRWQTFYISRTNIGGAYLENNDFFSARYLLGNNSVNYIQGTHTVGNPQDCLSHHILCISCQCDVGESVPPPRLSFSPYSLHSKAKGHINIDNRHGSTPIMGERPIFDFLQKSPTQYPQFHSQNAGCVCR